MERKGDLSFGVFVRMKRGRGVSSFGVFVRKELKVSVARYTSFCHRRSGGGGEQRECRSRANPAHRAERDRNSESLGQEGRKRREAPMSGSDLERHWGSAACDLLSRTTRHKSKRARQVCKHERDSEWLRAA